MHSVRLGMRSGFLTSTALALILTVSTTASAAPQNSNQMQPPRPAARDYSTPGSMPKPSTTMDDGIRFRGETLAFCWPSKAGLFDYVYDRESAMWSRDAFESVLDTAIMGSENNRVHIVAHNEFDPRVRSLEELAAIRQAGRRGFANPLTPPREPSRNGWRVVESLPGFASVSGIRPPAFFTTRISDHNADDIVVIDSSTAQLHVIAHPNGSFGAATFPPAEVSFRGATRGGSRFTLGNSWQKDRRDE